jgi:pimeloyl-ACP methyl ester carboxylesterase
MNSAQYSKIIIDTARGPICARSAGYPDSDLVIAVHGWSQRNGWLTWEPLMTPLSNAGLFVVSLDMPGWGDSPAWLDGSLKTEFAVNALIYVVDHFNKDRAVIMGKSWGGGVGLQCAMDHPSRVSKLILTAPAFRNLDSLNTLSQAVLLVWAEDDKVIPYRYSAEFLERIPNIEFISFKNGGHSAAPKNAELLAPSAVRFIRSSSNIID